MLTLRLFFEKALSVVLGFTCVLLVYMKHTLPYDVFTSIGEGGGGQFFDMTENLQTFLKRITFESLFSVGQTVRTK